MKTVAGITGKAPRRQHDQSFKTELVKQCLVPGASVAAIAMAGGINANLLFKWRRDHLRTKRLTATTAAASTVLVPVHVAPSSDRTVGVPPVEAPPALAPMTVMSQRVARSAGVIELDIADAQLRLRGPVDEASLCSVLRALRQST